MKRHWAYLKYIIAHKWFVLVASYKIGASLWLAIIHDWSKFLPSEWTPYAHAFYDANGAPRFNKTVNFNYAWNYHQKRNKHHWQYWLLTFDDGPLGLLKMPDKYVLEMLADWIGASRAMTGEWNVYKWYQKNKVIIKLHSDTRDFIEQLLCEHSDLCGFDKSVSLL